MLYFSATATKFASKCKAKNYQNQHLITVFSYSVTCLQTSKYQLIEKNKSPTKLYRAFFSTSKQSPPGTFPPRLENIAPILLGYHLCFVQMIIQTLDSVEIKKVYTTTFCRTKSETAQVTLISSIPMKLNGEIKLTSFLMLFFQSPLRKNMFLLQSTESTKFLQLFRRGPSSQKVDFSYSPRKMRKSSCHNHCFIQCNASQDRVFSAKSHQCSKTSFKRLTINLFWTAKHFYSS